ncbi:sensor histidine kinase [Murdochiella vaginalis]|uniref:sensor histidine kinase n=1 Tax=Murdochiella vaginalis TaxID=1852373 RepID=UPI0008FE574E|nr:sensor histidine kinase [Murdochiella vaginalis]
MTLYSVPEGTLALLFVICLFLLMISIRIVVEMMDMRPNFRVVLGSLLLFSACFLAAQVLAEIGSHKMRLGRWFLPLSVRYLIAFLVVLFLLEMLFIRWIQRNRKKEIGRNSIKESLDNLPDGVCFSRLDGTPLLVNRTMQEISYAVFGKWLVNDVACAEAIRANQIEPRATILQRDPLVIQSQQNIWLIQVIFHGDVKETLAYDITLEWALYEEIKKKNVEIQQRNAHLKNYQKRVSEYTRQKEILQAKIHIHDKIGQSLIYCKHYLEKKEKSREDRDRLLQLWRESLLVLEEKSDPPKVYTAWEKLLSTAQAIGVEMHLQGALPTEEKELSVFVDIVHEALNNAIRHGAAKNIDITLEQEDGMTRCTIRNDGTVPNAPIREKGGLKNIRERITLYGGEMSVSTTPSFALALSWPKGESNDL